MNGTFKPRFEVTWYTPEIHYQLGIALFLADDKDHAAYHWWYLVETYPDHPSHLRAYLNLAAESYPFAITELNGYRGASQMTYSNGESPPENERKRTKTIYEKVRGTTYPASLRTTAK